MDTYCCAQFKFHAVFVEGGSTKLRNDFIHRRYPRKTKR
jgi:hypothetical protein